MIKIGFKYNEERNVVLQKDITKEPPELGGSHEWVCDGCTGSRKTLVWWPGDRRIYSQAECAQDKIQVEEGPGVNFSMLLVLRMA